MKTIDHRGEATLSRKGLFFVSGSIGFVIAALVIFGTLLYINFRHLSHDNRIAISELQRITHPTPSQFRQDFKDGIKHCLEEPSCAHLFPGLTNQRKAARRRRRRAAAAEAQAAHRLALIYARREGSSKLPSEPVTVVAPPSRHSHRPSRRQGATAPAPGSGGSGGGGGSSATPPPQPSAPVTATTQLPSPLPNPSVCTDLAKINC